MPALSWLQEVPQRNRAFLAALFIVAACALTHAVLVERTWLFSRDPVAQSRYLADHDNIDLGLLLGSIARKPTAASTFAWWHESWEDQSPYWRPLTMQSFWLEKRLFTVDRFDRWMWVSLAWHIAFLASFCGFVYALTGRRSLAVLTLALYAVRIAAPWPFTDVAGVPNGDCVLDAWKNQPDLWTDTFVSLSLLLTARRRYGWALACATVAVCFKESGWVAFPLMLITAAWLRRLGDIRVAHLVGAFAIIAILVALRATAGHAVFRGYSMGTNHWWFSRYTHAVDGLYLGGALGEPAGWLYGNVLFLIGRLARRTRPIVTLMAWLALFAGAAVLDAYVNGVSLDVAAAQFFDVKSHELPTSVLVLAWLCGAACLARNKQMRRWALFAILGSCVSATMYVAATQVLEHALHMAYAFQAVFGATLAASVLEWAEERLRKPEAMPQSAPEVRVAVAG